MLVNQPFGLGDLIYVQYLLGIISSSVKVEFPIADEYWWLTDYLVKTPNIEYMKVSHIQNKINLHNPNPSGENLPLRWATQLRWGLAANDYSHDYSVMEDKYLICGVDPLHWVNYQFERKEDKENELFEKLGSPKDYILTNVNYGSDTVGRGSIEIPGLEDENKVEMSIIDGYTLFDWIKVIKEAREIHTVSTALVYLVDKYASEDCKLHVYQRGDEKMSLQGIENILTRFDWEFHYND